MSILFGTKYIFIILDSLTLKSWHQSIYSSLVSSLASQWWLYLCSTYYGHVLYARLKIVLIWFLVIKWSVQPCSHKANLALSSLPPQKKGSKVRNRFFLLFGLGLFSLFGSIRAVIGGSNLAGSGALGVLVLAFVAAQGWKEEEKVLLCTSVAITSECAGLPLGKLCS